jgi:hypothetical protein
MRNEMSSTLFISKNVSNKNLSFGQPLKGIIGRKFYNHDGSCGGELITVGSEYLDWFEGVLAAYPEFEGDYRELEKVVDMLREGHSLDIRIET